MKLRDKTNYEICKENNIGFSFLTNVVEEKNTKAKIRATLQVIEKILCGTLGPYGSTTIIQDREMSKHFATKDGYDLLNRINFSEELPRTILDMARSVASNQVNTVGDGSTSALVVASELYSELTAPDSKIFDTVAPKDVLDILKDISKYLEFELKAQARPISKDLKEIEKVAMIATNNDRKTGKFIKEIYDQIGEFGFISTDIMAKKEEDEYEIRQGIEWERGYIDEYFANGYENKKIIMDQEPRVFITNGTLIYDDISNILLPLIGQVCGTEKAELLIIANDYEEDVRKFFKLNRTQHLAGNRAELPFTVVDIDQVTQSSKATLADLAILLDSEIYDKLEHNAAQIMATPDRFVGRAAAITVTRKKTQVLGMDRSVKHIKSKKACVKQLTTALRKNMELEEPSNNELFDRYILQRRLSSLTDSTAVIHIAGKSLTERRTRERLFEDAILASKSAIKYGVIPGGNIMIPKILEDEITKPLADTLLISQLVEKYNYIPVFDKEIFIRDFLILVKDAFVASYYHVLSNSYFNEEKVNEVLSICLNENKFYNLKTHKYEDIDKTEVINSVDTDIQILQSVVSIIGIMATSNQMITMNFAVSDQIK